MINVNQITSQLARMPDQALQKYAMMNKNDPYTVSLALSESNRRKAMRSAAAPMPGQQPKVVDQDIAQMAAPQQQLPENVGIGQLPAQNIQGMADGGIVGYADRGLVETNQFVFPPEGIKDPQTGELIKPESWNALPKSQQMRLVGVLRSQAGLGAVPTNAYPGIQYGQYGPSIDQWKQMIANANPTIEQERAQNMAIVNAQTPTVDRGRPTMANDPRLLTNTQPVVANEAPAGAPPVAASPATPAPAGGITQLPPSLAGTGLKATPAGLPSVQSFTDQLMGIDKFLPTKEKAPDKEAFMQERQDISAPVWAKFESTINKEKDRLNEGKEQDFYMALIEGGLEAAAGNSPNGIQNLAAGFSKGAKSYSAALKDFRKAAQENTKLELDMERAKAAEKRGDLDAFQKAEDSIKNRNADIDKLKTQGIFALQNVHTSGAYQLASTERHVAGQLAAADLSGRYSLAAHGMPTGVERMVNQMPGKTFDEKLQAYSNIMGPDARSDAALLQKYAGKEGEMALKLLEAGTPQEQAYARMVRSKLQNAMLTPMSTPMGAVRP